MDSRPSEKRSVRLSIFNQTFSLLVQGDPAELEQAANQVDELMHTIARSGNVDTARAAILACLHLQDRVSALERELQAARQEQNERTAAADRLRQMAELLDHVVDGPS